MQDKQPELLDDCAIELTVLAGSSPRGRRRWGRLDYLRHYRSHDLHPLHHGLVGYASWWLPNWLDSLLFRLEIEGEPDNPQPIPAPAGSDIPR